MMQAEPVPVKALSVNKATQNAAFEMLMNAVGSLLGPVVYQLITSDPSLVNLKGWHGMTALHRACLIGDYNIVLLLVQASSDVNALTDAYESPLHYASKRGMPTVVHLLIQCGAKVDMRDKKGKSVIHHAAENGAVQVLKYFEDAMGMTFQDVDQHLQSPLHIACDRGQIDVFRFLISKERSDLRQPDLDGNLGIHLTAKAGYGHMTWLMLSYLGGSAVRVKNKHGYSPLDLALQNDKFGHKEAVELLRYYQDKPDSAKVKGPEYKWYCLLLYPFSLFTVLVILTQQFSSYQFWLFLLGGAIMFLSSKGMNHRMSDVSRWPNPFYAGFFGAGIMHTILCFFLLMFPYIYTNLFLCPLSFAAIGSLLFVYYKLIVQDPGSNRSSARHPTSGKLINLVDLCMMQKPDYMFCPFCDIVTNMVTKHCKMCNVCFHGMDHHCLFLMKCVAANNHALFIWLLIMGCVNMLLYAIGFVIYFSMRHGSIDYGDIISVIIHQEMWPFSLLLLNISSAFWSGCLIFYQFKVVSRGGTSYFPEEFHREQIFSTRDVLENFIYFLLGKPLPHSNPYSPFLKESPGSLTV